MCYPHNNIEIIINIDIVDMKRMTLLCYLGHALYYVCLALPTARFKGWVGRLAFYLIFTKNNWKFPLQIHSKCKFCKQNSPMEDLDNIVFLNRIASLNTRILRQSRYLKQ